MLTQRWGGLNPRAGISAADARAPLITLLAWSNIGASRAQRRTTIWDGLNGQGFNTSPSPNVAAS
jgi:hypothetical protein